MQSDNIIYAKLHGKLKPFESILTLG